MTQQLMVQPSSLLPKGIQISQVNDLNFFKFTDVQTRSDELLERSKAGLLTPNEAAEMAGISELARVFTFVNAVLAAQP